MRVNNIESVAAKATDALTVIGHSWRLKLQRQENSHAALVQVILCIILVVIVGSLLSQSADVQLRKLVWGVRLARFLAGATSLPELATGVSAIVVFNAPDLQQAASLVVVFNLFLPALLDILTGPGLFQRAQISHGLAAGLGSVMLGCG